MDFNKLGKLAEQATRQALEVIQEEQRSGRYAAKQEDNPYVRGGKSVTTTVDVRAQRIYTDLFADKTPEIGIMAEEKDPLLKIRESVRATWVIDGVDGTSRLIEKAPSGYGTQCALLLGDGTVPIAFVGDATTGEIFGYHGKSGVFRIDKHGKRSKINSATRELTLSELGGLRRPPIELYHPLSQRVLLSGKVGNIREFSGGIGTTIALLFTDEIGLFALRPHHERPWDAIPAYALCAEAGMVFMTPAKDGKSFTKWKPLHTLETYMRDFDLLVVHHTRVATLHTAATNCM